MHSYSKAALAVLAVALSSAPILAQDEPQGPPPEQQGPQDEFMAGGPMQPGDIGEEMGPMEPDRGGSGPGRQMGRRGFGRERGEFGLMRLLNDPAFREKVGITAEQVGAIRKQVSDYRKARIRERADVEVKRVELKDLLEADKPDRAAVDAKLQEISTARLALEKSAIHFRLAMKDAISPEQREKIRQLMRERRREGGAGRPGCCGQGQMGHMGMGQHDHAQAPPDHEQAQPKN